MKIKILTVGKTKDAWCAAGEAEYEKRLSAFCDLEKISVSEEKISPAISEAEVKKREGTKILEKIPTDFLVIALSPDGKPLSSANFAALLQDVRDFKGGKICFIIGGALGLDQKVLASADKIISFSELTFPHDLFRIILLEQIYRGFTILQGKNYHR